MESKETHCSIASSGVKQTKREKYRGSCGKFVRKRIAISCLRTSYVLYIESKSIAKVSHIVYKDLKRSFKDKLLVAERQSSKLLFRGLRDLVWGDIYQSLGCVLSNQLLTTCSTCCTYLVRTFNIEQKYRFCFKCRRLAKH